MIVLRNKIFLLGFMLLIPVIWITIGSLVTSGYEKEYEVAMASIIKKEIGEDITKDYRLFNKIKLINVCNKHDLDSAFREICTEYDQIKMLTEISILILIFTILAFTFIFFLGGVSLKNRYFLFYLFKPGLFISQLCSSILVASNAGIIVASIYFAESFYLGKIHVILLVILGLGAASASISVFVQSFTRIKAPNTVVLGKILRKEDHPTIWEFVEKLARKIGAEPPNTIIAGLDATFFVTEANITCLEGDIKGRTLFISLPFCHTLSKSEFAAIVGHEMGHFVGEDTKWSRKFYPIYRGAVETIHSLYYSEDENDLLQAATLPSLLFMSMFINSFEKSEKSISRERELRADRMGAHLTSPEAMGMALLKVHLYQYIWVVVKKQMKENLPNVVANIPNYFGTLIVILLCQLG